MSSRRDQLASVERRVKRELVKHGLDLLKPLKPDSRVTAHGGYKLRDAKTGKIVFGELPYPFCKTLEEVEAYIEDMEGSSSD
ncbi:MAG: hypothetical protein ABL879_14305 [Devosia sp.]